MIPAEKLRRIRNEVSIDEVLRALGVPTKLREGYLRFLCPLCDDFNTATNPRTNLARCFRCQRNFNPIDLIMIVDRASFLEAVGQLGECLPPSTHHRQIGAVPDRH